MTWNHDISQAPRGKTVKATRLVKDTKTGDKVPLAYEEHQADIVILATKCDRAIRSYWIEKEQRWAGLAPNEQPEAWMDWPIHPRLSKPIQAEGAQL